MMEIEERFRQETTIASVITIMGTFNEFINK